MSDDQKQLRGKFNFLTDELVENIINTPDKEILNEIKEDYGDSSFVANKVREILKQSKISAGKERLKAAREEINYSKNKSQQRTG